MNCTQNNYKMKTTHQSFLLQSRSKPPPLSPQLVIPLVPADSDDGEVGGVHHHHHDLVGPVLHNPTTSANTILWRWIHILASDHEWIPEKFVNIFIKTKQYSTLLLMWAEVCVCHR